MSTASSADSKPATVHAPIVDWSKTPLTADYEGPYVKILDNVFTAEECAELIALAESDAKWEQAAVHYGLGPNDKYVDTKYRNSQRILRFDKAAAAKLYERLQPYVQELAKIEGGEDWAGIFGTPEYVEGEWTCVGYVLSFTSIHDKRLTLKSVSMKG